MRVGEWVAGAGASLLLASLFAPWVHRPASNPALIETRSGWLVLGVFSIVMVAAATVPLWQLAQHVRRRRGLRPQALVCAGAAAVTAVIATLGFRMGESEQPGGGLHLGLVAAGLMVLGGVLAVWLAPVPGPSVAQAQAHGPGGPGSGHQSPESGGRPRVDSGDAQRSRARSLRGRGRGTRPGTTEPAGSGGTTEPAGPDSHCSQRAVARAAGLRPIVLVVALRA
ncbi:MAG: hypothetical protein ACR2GF_03070 [Acidimicrobiales bacterium]